MLPGSRLLVSPGKRDSEIVEEALRSYLGLGVVDAVRERAAMGGDAADALEELHASRARG